MEASVSLKRYRKSRQLRKIRLIKTIKDLLSIKDKWILPIHLGEIFLLNARRNTRVKAGIQD